MKIRQLTFILTKLIIDTLASRENETLLLKFDGIERYLPVAKSSTVKGSGDGAERKCTVQMSYDQAHMLLEEKLLDVEVLREDTLPSFEASKD